MSRPPKTPAQPKGGYGHGGKGERYNPKSYDGRNFHNGHPIGGCSTCRGGK